MEGVANNWVGVLENWKLCLSLLNELLVQGLIGRDKVFFQGFVEVNFKHVKVPMRESNQIC